MTDTFQNQAETMESCRRMLDDPDGAVRLQGLAALVPEQVDPSPLLEPIGRCLTDPEEGVRLLAVHILARSTQSVDLLLAATLPVQPSAVRTAAIAALGRMKEQAQSAVETLAGYLGADENDLRANTIVALKTIGAPAVPRLIACSVAGHESVRIGAIDALGWMGATAAAAVECLKTAQEDPALPVRLAASAAMVKITGDSASGLPMLLQHLGHAEAIVRKTCVERIGELRESAGGATADLLPHLQDPAADVRAATALALVRIKAQCGEAVPQLIPQLKDPESDVRANAAIALATIGPAARSALPELSALVQDPDGRIAGLATAAIERISAQA